ncbi:hypothetical protein GCM10010123_27440 [Pilimelia anulata]|uniref:Uncharacterized protein n=1 Tax=Pilimelia anulata TaxID=53371 RepID=A0A8J3B5Y0_9ACTN|nr:hypothetical protein [Pilimelia anulata]GGJ96029.1 hypothetical protein GCM10010123_27440 [Pilimelia anulata]
MIRSVGQPRRFGVRLVLAGATDLAVFGGAYAAATLGAAATGGAVPALALAGVVPALFMLWAAPLVSYRRRDALLCLCLIGIALVPVVAWRLVYLPHRDWRPRPDEQRPVRRPAEPGRPGGRRPAAARARQRWGGSPD